MRRGIDPPWPGGFHVFIDEPGLDEPSTLMERVAVPFLAFERDFVGADRRHSSGNIHAVFRRLHLAIVSYVLALKRRRQAAAERQKTERPARQRADHKRYQRWVRENRGAAWLGRALVEIAPEGATEPSRVWIQHQERHRPLRVVPLSSPERGPDPPMAA